MISDLHRIRFDVHKQYWRGVERLFGSLLAFVDGQNCAIQCISGDIRTVRGNFKSVFCTKVYIYINIVFSFSAYIYICLYMHSRIVWIPISVQQQKHTIFPIYQLVIWNQGLHVVLGVVLSLGTTVECASGISTRFGNRSSQPVPQSRYYFDVDGVIPNMITWNQI